MHPSPVRTFEYLDPDTLLGSSEFMDVERFLRDTRRTEIGWHYIVDLTWIYRQALGWPRQARVLDVGGGGGPAQFLLAEMGFQVTNVDLRHSLPAENWRQRYGVTFERLPSYEASTYVDHLQATYGTVPAPQPSGAMARLKARWRRTWPAQGMFGGRLGTVHLVEGNMCAVPELPDHGFAAVVSLSSVEHISLEDLGRALAEIRRVAQPDARWAVTTSATHATQSWFHEPAQGWCYSEDDLARLFDARTAGGSALEILEHYRTCRYLREHLAAFYSKSDRNGMPWGRWDPRYVPVGIR